MAFGSGRERLTPYAYSTLTQVLAQISLRLDDPNNVRWSTAELTLYLQEALRTWQSLTGYWRNRFVFNLVLDETFYDLAQLTGSPVSYSITDAYLLSEMLYHLIEPQIAGGSYVGTDMFSAADFTNALQNRRNQFLEETGMVLTVADSMTWPSPGQGRAPLPDSTIDIRRAAWASQVTGLYSTVWRSSEFGARAFSPSWATSPADPPSEYSIAAEPPVSLQLIPPPLNPGAIELLTVNAGANLNPLAGVLLGIPDNLSWVVKWGALADLLGKEGQAHDPDRQKYCEQRWREGIQIARIHTSVVNTLLNGVQVFTNALNSLDAFLPNWQNDANGPPVDAALASWNMFVVHPAPDSNGPYSVALDVVQNAPVPVLPGDFIQVGREELDVIVDYCVHLADFKEGGGEFLNTTGYYDNMLRLAGVYNERLHAAVDFEDAMGSRAIRDESLVPRRVPVEQGG